MQTILKDKIDALIAYANETTGKEDTRLDDAVKSLADGYGGGGEGVQVLEGDINISTNSNAIPVTHNLGIKPILATIMPDDLGGSNVKFSLVTFSELLFGGNAFGMTVFGNFFAAVEQGSPSSQYASWLNTKQVRFYSGNSSRLFTSGNYHYKIYYTNV